MLFLFTPVSPSGHGQVVWTGVDERCGILIVAIFLGMEWHTLSHMAGTYGTPMGGAKSPFIFQIPKKSKNTSFKLKMATRALDVVVESVKFHTILKIQQLLGSMQFLYNVKKTVVI